MSSQVTKAGDDFGEPLAGRSLVGGLCELAARKDRDSDDPTIPDEPTVLAFVEERLGQGDDPNAVCAEYKWGPSVLHLATTLCYPDVVERLIQAGAKVNARDLARWTPLMIAAHNLCLPVAGCLLAHGADTEVYHNGGLTPVYIAARRSGSLEMVRLLLASGATLRRPTGLERGTTPLHDAVFLRAIGLVAYHLEEGVDVNARSSKDLTPLQIALLNLDFVHRQENREIAQLLVENGADVNVRDWWERTPLHLALEKCQEELAIFLIERGADVRAITNGPHPIVGRITPLHRAVGCGLRSVVRLLVEWGADGSVADSNGDTPLHRLSVGEDVLEILTLLLEHGAAINARSRSGETVLSHVIYRYRWGKSLSRCPIDAAIDLLLARGAEPLAGTAKRNAIVAAVQENLPDVLVKLLGYLPGVSLQYLSTALLEGAAARDAVECIRLLLPFGVQPGGPFPARKKTPLHVAAGKNAVNLLRLCLEAGADPNAEDKDGNTPLHIAAAKDRPDACRLLLQFNADPTRTNNDGKTPRQVAQDKNKRRVLAVL